MSDLKSDIREFLIELCELSKTVDDDWVEEYEVFFEGSELNMISETTLFTGLAKKQNKNSYPGNFYQLLKECCEELGMAREEYFMLDAPPGAKYFRIHLR